MAGIGSTYAMRNAVPVRRALLRKSQQFVYYFVDEQAGEVVILTIWGARRRSGPRL
jgi:hypothetical protein